MKYFLKYTTSLSLVLLILSYSCKERNKNVGEAEKVIQKEQPYSIDKTGLSVQWTAYKFTNKVAVSGTFDQHEFKLQRESGSVEELLKDAEMTIITSSVNSGNIIRDPKLRTSFFKVFNADTINGKILDASRSSGTLELEMNNISKDVKYDYTIKNDTLFLTTHLDLIIWKGEKALSSLNNECYELHTGTDGISKLWPNVDVTMKLPLRVDTTSN